MIPVMLNKHTERETELSFAGLLLLGSPWKKSTDWIKHLAQNLAIN